MPFLRAGRRHGPERSPLLTIRYCRRFTFRKSNLHKDATKVAYQSAIPSWQRALIVMAGAVVTAIVVMALYLVQAVFIPLALAVFLTFLLHPLIRLMQKMGLNRIVSVILVVVITSLVLTGLFWLVYAQVTGLMTELPKYERNILEKAKSLREATSGEASARIVQMFDHLLQELGVSSSPDESATPVVNRETPGWIKGLPRYLGSVAELVGGLALAIVLTIFMLFSREDLRNRFLRLVGSGRMPFATKAVDDAAQRLSRFLLMQAIVNATYGMAVGIGLLLLGVDYALLWGFLAAVLRYVPYIGPWIAAFFPIALGLITFQGWWQPLTIVAFFLVLELISNNVMEPMLYGQSMGVSEVALLVAAAFWAWLWGPIGLVLSAPLTVCLIVLGKYVPQLQFLDVLLGDDPPLEPDVTFYQRLLARDQDEAAGIVLEEVKKSDPEDVYERVLISALSFLRRDRERDDVTPSDEQFVLRAISELVEDLGEGAALSELAVEKAPLLTERVPVLACPARDAVDAVALEIVKQALEPTRWAIEIAAAETLSAELMDRIQKENPPLVLIGTVAPGGLAHTRYLCKRLRSRFPNIKIVVGRWGLKDDAPGIQEKFRDAGADVATSTLADTRIEMESLRQVCVQAGSPTSMESNQKTGGDAEILTHAEVA